MRKCDTCGKVEVSWPRKNCDSCKVLIVTVNKLPTAFGGNTKRWEKNLEAAKMAIKAANDEQERINQLVKRRRGH